MEHGGYQYDGNWNMFTYFALIVTLILYCVLLIVNISFGDMVITHITTRPYKIALLILMAYGMTTGIQLIFTEVIWKN